MICVSNVYKSFGTQTVLNGLSLEVADGEILSIVGPSGVGKSVLLKLIVGILEPDAGEIELYGQNITRAKCEREKNKIRELLGVLYQSAALFDSLTIYENVAFPLLERSRMNRKQAHEKVVDMLDSISLCNYAKLCPE